MKQIFIALVFFTYFFSSCSYVEKQKRIDQIDSLQTELKSIETNMIAVDIASVKEKMDSIDYITESIAVDTSDKDFMILVGDVKRVKKNIFKFITEYNLQKTQFDYTVNQLVSFKTDVDNGFYDEEKFRMILNSEADAIERMLEANNNLMAWHDSMLRQHKALLNKLNEAIAIKNNPK
jgi:hypothetical protein